MTKTMKAVEFGFNKYCGPAVLSIITGKTTDECASVISRINGQYQVAGVMLHDLLLAANKLGFDAIDSKVDGVSLFRSMLDLSRRGDATYIISVPGHFVCLEVSDNKIYFCDNHTKEPIPAASSARLSMLVQKCYKVIKIANYVEPIKEVKKEMFIPLHITAYKCPECNMYALTEITIVHSPECRWRDMV